MYLRQSVDRDGTGLAIARQREDCLKLCADRGWQAVEYVDNDTSASSQKVRPAYVRMPADVEAVRFDAVVAWDLHRLHRRPVELERFIDLADRYRLALATTGAFSPVSRELWPVARSNGSRPDRSVRTVSERTLANPRFRWPPGGWL